MTTHKKDALAFAACLGVWAVVGGWGEGPAPAEPAVPDLPRPPAVTLLADKPAHEGEDPDEDALPRTFGAVGANAGKRIARSDHP